MKKQNIKSVFNFQWLKNIAIIIVLINFYACESFLEVDFPDSQLTQQEVFEDEETATAALTTLYSKLRDYALLSGTGSGLSVYMGLYADEIDYYGQPGSTPDNFYNHTVVPSSLAVSDFWNNSYSLIYAANLIIEGTELSSNLTENQKKQLTGEALFIRGLIHFYLTNLFGEIPYIKTSEYTQNMDVTKMPEEEIYSNILTDLLRSKSMLSENYNSSERIRPNKFTATALLARVYLYFEDWQKAEMESSQIINQTNTYQWVNNLDQVFLKESTAAIWQFKPTTPGANTKEAVTFIFATGPPPNYALNSGFVNEMDTNDLRKTHWIKEVTNGTDTWYHPFKYKQNSNTGTSLEYSILFRLGEQYLIRAEARARQGNLEGAKNDVNKIRNRAGLENTTVISQEQLINVILRERKYELFTEIGHRWFDLKRTQQAAQALSGIKPGWKSTDILLPLPENELLLNPNLQPQNPGY